MCGWSRSGRAASSVGCCCSTTPATRSALVNRFLSHLTDSGYSPNTVCAYAYDLRHLVAVPGRAGLTLEEFPAVDGAGVPGLSAADAVPASGAAAWLDGRDRARPAAVGGDGAAGPCGDVELLRVGDRGRAVHHWREPDAATGRSRIGSRSGAASAVRRRGEPAATGAPHGAGAAAAAPAAADDERGHRRAAGQPDHVCAIWRSSC